MILRYLLGSWSPNKYHQLHELSVMRLWKLVIMTAALSILVFLALLIPSLLQVDASVSSLRQTTDITLSATFNQSTPTYLAHNPDILVSKTGGDAFITITPEGLTIKRFIYFGAMTYPWDAYASLHSLQFQHLVLRWFVLLLPSIIFWATLFLLASMLLCALLYTLIAYFILHARNFHILYSDLWKVSIYATLPSMMLFAFIPMLRLGLPVSIIIGFLFVLWLVFALLGTALFAERHTPKFKKA